jgi:tRNA modification GTPase
LLHEISTRLTSGFSVSGDELLIIESERQYQLLDASEVALIRALELVDEDIPLDITAVELGEALDNLGQLTGEVTPSDILETIFSGFCVGK